MNIREGMRRLGILLGASGAILGGFLASPDVKSAWDSHRAYRRFESLMASPTMEKVVKALQDYLKPDKFGGIKVVQSQAVTYADGAIWEDVPEGTRQPEVKDLSKLTDEQLEVYRDLLAQKQGKAPFPKQRRPDTAIPTFEEFKKEADTTDW